MRELRRDLDEAVFRVRSLERSSTEVSQRVGEDAKRMTKQLAEMEDAIAEHTGSADEVKSAVAELKKKQLSAEADRMAPVKAFAAETVSKIDAVDTKFQEATAQLARQLAALGRDKADAPELDKLTRQAKKAEQANEDARQTAEELSRALHELQTLVTHGQKTLNDEQAHMKKHSEDFAKSLISTGFGKVDARISKVERKVTVITTQLDEEGEARIALKAQTGLSIGKCGACGQLSGVGRAISGSAKIPTVVSRKGTVIKPETPVGVALSQHRQTWQYNQRPATAAGTMAASASTPNLATTSVDSGPAATPKLEERSLG